MAGNDGRELQSLLAAALKAAGGNEDAVQRAYTSLLESNPGTLPDGEMLCATAKRLSENEARTARRQSARLRGATDVSNVAGATADAIEQIADVRGGGIDHADFTLASRDARTVLRADFSDFARRFIERAMPYCGAPTIEVLAQLLDRATRALEAGDDGTLKRMSAAGKVAGAGRAVPKDKTDRILWALNANHRNLPPQSAADSVLATVAWLYPDLDEVGEFEPARLACLYAAPQCIEPDDEAERECLRLGARFGKCQSSLRRSPRRVTIEANARHKLRQWDEENPKPEPVGQRDWRDRRSLHAVTVALTELAGAATANRILAPARVDKSQRQKEEAERRAAWIAKLEETTPEPGSTGEPE